MDDLKVGWKTSSMKRLCEMVRKCVGLDSTFKNCSGLENLKVQIKLMTWKLYISILKIYILLPRIVHQI